jgi:hypothetical protein
MTHDFWLTSGWHLLARDENGFMVPTVDFMRAYFCRDEVAPVPESCPAEMVLHKKLTDDPFAAVVPTDLFEIADKDVVHNYQAVLRFRDFISHYNSLEDAYMAITRGAKIQFPPLFVEQMAQIILRNILDGETDPMQIRAAELLFRDQAVTLDDGRIMVADHATVQVQVGMQKAQNNGVAATNAAASNEVMIDILATETADEYWQRSDNFNTSVDIAYTQPALDGLARVLEKWISHFLPLSVRITPMVKIEDEAWAWHVGLDTQSTAILNDLYHGKDVEEERLRCILCLFKLEAENGFVPDMNNKPIYLGLAMDSAGVVRLKPQNLLVNLPLATPS